MLDTDTKRRIDTARDILVGKVPDPKSQVEQITIALIYKFMDDMDAESEEMGGKRKFFTGDFIRFGWAKLMRSGLGGHETLNLYGEAIAKMPENPGIPPLFREIFKNAYLPYRDPETLRSFLKIIDDFSYDHSERLGDAFEYLLSVLGSQGDAGQFRTPRHIIDFMVKVIDPKKTETVLDPACGTAGFLISSYKHILKANTNAKGESTLTPDEKRSIAQNFKGYDISPDMVRLSLVNLYLHGFADPHVYEYDTLTSQDRWADYADVILANPPFMSPKGGIKPHNRFSVQSKRSEVLFVDYMAEHLTPNGRAVIIVPEGIIFQSQAAYVQLRKMLVEQSLVAVVSLPAGVFNPYSGVKTSILILDKSLAKKSNTIAFFKVENDGFGLGAQRRPIEKNDLPQVETELKTYFQAVQGQQPVSELKLTCGLIVAKEKIAENKEYNLSGERYREGWVHPTSFPHVSLADVTVDKPQYGSGASKIPYDGNVRYIRITDITDKGELKSDDPVSPSVIEPEHFLVADDLLIARSGSVGRAYLHKHLVGTCQYAGYLIRFRIDPSKAIPAYVYRIVQSPLWWDWIASNSKTGTLTNINAQQYASFIFPLPPLEVQKEIVVEIEGYQKIINGARAILDNYRPHIPIHPDWPLMKLKEVSEINPKKSEVDGLPGDTIVSFVPMAALGEHSITFEPAESKPLSEVASGYTYFRDNDVVIAKVTPCFENGKAGIARKLSNGIGFGSSELFVIRVSERVLPEWAYFAVANPTFRSTATEKMTGTGGLQRVPRSVLEEHIIPVPALEIQRAIISEIEAEQAIVVGTRELITRFEKKIQTTLSHIWGEGIPASAGM